MEILPDPGILHTNYQHVLEPINDSEKQKNGEGPKQGYLLNLILAKHSQKPTMLASAAFYLSTRV
jgi:hypothetical protein